MAYFMPEKAARLGSIVFSAVFFFFIGSLIAVLPDNLVDSQQVMAVTAVSCSLFLAASLLITIVSAIAQMRKPEPLSIEVREKHYPSTKLLPRAVAPRPVTSLDTYTLIDPDASTIRVGDIDSNSLNRFRINCEMAIADDIPRIRVEVESSGGMTLSALAMFDYIRELSKSHDVYVCVTGMCYSAAILVLAAVPIEKRLCNANARFMLHTSSGQSPAEVQAMNTKTTDHIVANSYISRNDLHHLMKDGRNCFFDAPEALRLGLVGKVA